MTCTTFDKHCEPARGADCRAAERPAMRVARLIARVGERLFPYRLVRAEVIHRILERPADRRKSP